MKLLIVNADDLGYDPEIDRGILEAHARGIVSSASAMVETPFAASSLRAAPQSLGIGLHAVLAAGLGTAGAEAALRRQLARFEDLRGAAPTHIDSHKHVHAHAQILAAVIAVAAERDLPVRSIDPGMRSALRTGGVLTADAFFGDAERRPAWTREALLAALSRVNEGVTELMAHPGHSPSHVKTSFGQEREVELISLCDAAARALLERSGVRLCNYGEVRRHLRSSPARAERSGPT